MSTSSPTVKQRRLVTVIIKFSAPLWFLIKCNPLAVDGARIMFTAIQLLKELHPEDQSVAKKVIQRNGWFCHPDQVVLAMLTDTGDSDMRNRAVDLMLKLRRETVLSEKMQSDDESEENSVEVSEDLLVASESEYSEDDLDESMEDNVRRVVIPKIN